MSSGVWTKMWTVRSDATATATLRASNRIVEAERLENRGNPGGDLKWIDRVAGHESGGKAAISGKARRARSAPSFTIASRRKHSRGVA